MSEEWRDVRLFEGEYQVSDRGRIRSLDREINDRRLGQRKVKGKVLRTAPPALSPNDALIVQLVTFRGDPVFYWVHMLVVGAFMYEPPKGQCINFGDNGSHDPSLANLEYQYGNHGFHYFTRLYEG